MSSPLVDIIQKYAPPSGEDGNKVQNTNDLPDEKMDAKSDTVSNVNVDDKTSTAPDNQNSSAIQNQTNQMDTNVSGKKLEEMTSDELIGELKKWQRIAEERKVLIEKQQSANDESANIFREFVSKAKEDFWGAYKEFSDKIGLPPYDFVYNQVKVGDLDAQIEAYQNNVLVPEIMEKYGLDEFEFDPKEAWIPKTPSYEFRQKTEEYSKKLRAKFDEEVKTANELKSKIAEQIEKDKEFLKQYFSSEDEFNQLFDEFNNPKDDKMFSDLSNHILSLKNLFRGYYFDVLVDKIVKKREQEIHNQYAKLGIKLPKVDVPLDTTNIKDNSVPSTENFDDSKTKVSPLYRTLKRFGNV